MKDVRKNCCRCKKFSIGETYV